MARCSFVLLKSFEMGLFRVPQSVPSLPRIQQQQISIAQTRCKFDNLDPTQLQIERQHCTDAAYSLNLAYLVWQVSQGRGKEVFGAFGNPTLTLLSSDSLPHELQKQKNNEVVRRQQALLLSWPTAMPAQLFQTGREKSQMGQSNFDNRIQVHFKPPLFLKEHTHARTRTHTVQVCLCIKMIPRGRAEAQNQLKSFPKGFFTPFQTSPHSLCLSVDATSPTLSLSNRAPSQNVGKRRLF